MLKFRKLLKFSLIKNCLRPFSEVSDYQKKCFEFEENWQAISNEKNVQLTKTLEEELTLDQKNYITALAKAFANLTIYELDYYYDLVIQATEKIKPPPTMSMLFDWPSLKKNGSFIKKLRKHFKILV